MTMTMLLVAVRETKQIRTEIVTVLTVADRLYSEVEENVPDPSPLSANRKEIETILEQVCRHCSIELSHEQDTVICAYTFMQLNIAIERLDARKDKTKIDNHRLHFACHS
jgi:uncharacterized membrane protein